DALSDTRTGGAIMWFGGDGIMAVIMVIIAIGWIHRPAGAQVEPGGWLEQARRASFAVNTGNAGTEEQAAALDQDTGFDEDDLRLRQYNEWLRRLNSPSKG
ncbi:MAG: cytochrome c oxidase assembly protein, partial [Jatrophihabitantaceae bacterium]